MIKMTQIVLDGNLNLFRDLDQAIGDLDRAESVFDPLKGLRSCYGGLRSCRK